jgi:hypothetical protein
MIVRRFLILLGLLAGAAALVSSCRDASPVGVETRGPRVLASRGTHASDDENEDGDSLVSCRPLPYESETRTIGPAGGVLEVRHNWLVVPRGALSAPVTITAIAPTDTVAVIRFQPEGLRFLKTAYLVAAYDNCRVPRRVTPRIAFVTDALDVIEFLVPVDVALDAHVLRKTRMGRHVIGELHHFSNYAVAW